MKVFMTGSTTLQANMRKIPEKHKLDVPAGLVRLLRDAGHEVTWTNFTVGDQLPDCDLVWVSIAPPASFNAPYALDATWAIYQAKQVSLPLVIFFDDWQFQTVFAGYGAFTNRGAAQIQKKTQVRYMYLNDIDRAVNFTDEIVATSQDIVDGSVFDYAVPVIPKYQGWGDRGIVSALMPKTPEVYPIEPTPLLADVLAAYRPTDAPKARDWFLAAIVNHQRWVKKMQLSWPVNFAGVRLMPGERLTEAEVLQECSRHWGILSPIYPQAGSGWWRARFIYAAVADSVLYCGQGDADALGSAYCLTPERIEALSDWDLALFAFNQRATLFPKLVTEEAALLEQMYVAFNAANERVSTRAHLV